ncbi:MAG: RecB family exonuclease [Acidothermaceae bacterium]
MAVDDTAVDDKPVHDTPVDDTAGDPGAGGPGASDPGASDPGAVSGSRPWALSPSRAGDFMTCPLLYRFRVIDRLPEPPNPITTRGTLVHAVLERLFDHPAPLRTIERAAELLDPEWQRLLAEQPELAELFPNDASVAGSSPTGTQPTGTQPAGAQPTGTQPAGAQPTGTEHNSAPTPRVLDWLASARRLLETYFSLEDPARVEPAQRELLVEVELDGGVRLRGFIDRVDVAPAGQVRIVDYKTGNAPSELFEDKALFQLKFYALVMWRVSGRIPTLLQLMYLGDGQVLRYSPDESDLRATERKVRALWAAVERALANRDFPPRRSRLCDWCAHQSVCPEFGGTPPAYPEVPVVVPVDEPTWIDQATP